MMNDRPLFDNTTIMRTKMHGRALMLITLLALLGACSPEPVKPEDDTPVVNPPTPVIDYSKTSLGDVAEKIGLKLGAAFTYWEYMNNRQVGEILTREFKAVTFGNEMKHDAIVQSNGQMRFTTADQMAGWARLAGAELFGHVLGWHSQQQTAYLNTLISKAPANNKASLLKSNWNFEAGTLEGYQASGMELTTDYLQVFAGDYAALALADGASLAFDVALEPETSYQVSFWAKGPGTITLSTGDGQSGTATVTGEWKKFSALVPCTGIGDFAYKLILSQGVSVDNIRVVSTDPNQGSGNPYINAHALDGGIDFDGYTAGPSAQITASGEFVQINGPSYVSVTGENPHSGELCLKMDNSGGVAVDLWDIQVITRDFSVEPGKTYRIAWYARASQDADLQIDIRLPSGIVYRNSAWGQYPQVGTDWTYQYVDITPSAGDNSMAVAFYGGTSVAVYYLDDIQIFDTAYVETRGDAPGLTFTSTADLAGELANDAIGAAFKNYVYGMVQHFDTYAWDVVNETFADGSGQFRTRQNTSNGFVWGTYFGSTKNWVDKAFAYAADACRRYGKTPVLYLNDYNLEIDNAKLSAYCEYAKNNPDVTGVGTQMHLDMAIPGLESKIENHLRALVATGKMVRISELDIKTTDENRQAELFKFIFQKYLEIVPQAQRGGITFWGINDKDSWVGENNAPLLWKGTDYQKKAGYKTLYLYLCELAGVDPYQ